MMRSLRVRLTGLYALLSALVLAVALTAGGLLEVRDLRRSSDESLLGAASVVAARLAGATTLADSWLTEQEQAYDCVYYLEDNGVPLAHIGHNGAAALLTAEARERCADLALAPVDLRHGPPAGAGTASLNARLAEMAAKYALL